MRCVGVFFGVLFFSLFALTDNYAGQGQWKSNEGESGNYSVEASIEASEGIITIDQTLYFDDQTINFVINLEAQSEDFYNLIDAGNGDVIGQGYCWHLEGEDKVCHSYSHHGDFIIESTIEKHGAFLYRIGSKTNPATGKKVIWKDTLLKTE